MEAYEPVNILLVDDQPATLLSYEGILRPLGENLLKATSGREALAHLLHTDIAVIVMDVNMPEIDGVAFASILREHPRSRQVAIIFLSGVPFTDLDLVQGSEYGAVDYLTVPILPGLLRAKVRVFADLSRKTRAVARLHRDDAQALRAHLAALVDASDDAIIGQTVEGIITSWNRGAERLYGYTAVEAIGQPMTLLCPPELGHVVPQLLARLARGEHITQYETQRLAKDGTRRAVSLTLSPIPDRRGRMRGTSEIARDIMARQQAEAELERRRQETALLAEIAQHFSASLDLDTVLQRVVSGAQELCGSERVFLALRDAGTDTLVGRYEVGAPQRAYAGFRIVPGQGLGGQVLVTGRPWRTEDYAVDPRFGKEYLARARAGGHLAVLAVPILMGAHVEGLLYASNPAAHPFTDRDEAILARLATHAALAIQNAQLYQQAQRELAERQAAEAALARAAAELEQRVAARTVALQQEIAERQRVERDAQRVQHLALLGRLAAGVSHEIRNPLAAIFLHTDLVEEELRQPSPQSADVLAEAVVEIKAQLARVDDLVQDYLSLARVHQSEHTPQDLGTALADWVAEWQQTARPQGVMLAMTGVAQLGTVALHPSTLRPALFNLVQNALDAMPQGGRLTLTGQRTATHVQLQVQDTGSGIPAAQLAQIFEPLYTTKPQGTGLGLYIVREIITAHARQLTVESVEGQGTIFTVTLPWAEGVLER